MRPAGAGLLGGGVRLPSGQSLQDGGIFRPPTVPDKGNPAARRGRKAHGPPYERPRGPTNPQTGAGLGIGRGTAKVHVQNTIAKLGVSDRPQAAVRAVDLGLFEPGG